MQVRQIESTRRQISRIWQQQSQQKKWLFGIATIAGAGLVMRANQQRVPSGAGLLQGLFSMFVLAFRLKSISQFCMNEKSTVDQ